MENKLNILSNLDFFSKLTAEQQNSLVSQSKIVEYVKGQNVYSASAECLGLLIVLSGELRAYMISDTGREITLYRLGENKTCVLSASCLLRKITFDVFIDAEIQTKVLLVNAAAFESVQSQNIYAQNYALSLAVEKFSDVMWSMEQLLFYPIEQRVALFLFDEYNRTKISSLALTHEQIAKYIGSAREVVSRTLKKFEKQNIISLSNGRVEILKAQKLNI